MCLGGWDYSDFSNIADIAYITYNYTRKLGAYVFAS